MDAPTPEAKPQSRHRGPLIAALMALLALALLWPALVQQRPSYFFDSASYLTTGAKSFTVARHRVEAKFARLVNDDTPLANPQAAPGKAPDQVLSVRALAYSLFAALTGAPEGKLFGLIAFNALVITLLIWEFWRIRAPNAPPEDIAAAVVFVAVASTAPWFVCYAMPDVLAGASILAMLILTFAPLHHDRLIRLGIGLVVAFAVAAHASHVPIIGLLVGAAVAELLWSAWRGRGWSWRRLAWVVGPFVAGIGLILALSVVGFGSVSVAPKRLPFALARSISDGPGKWYLEATCPTKRWAVCPFFVATGKRGPPLIFAKGGLIKSATPAQMDAVRAEEMTIVRAASKTYLGIQVRATAGNMVKQFFRFGLEDNGFDFIITPIGINEWRVKRLTERYDLRRFAEPLTLAGVVVSALMILGFAGPGWVRRLNSAEAGTVRLMVAGLVANAAVTGALSALTGRYQSRVIWVVPVVALALWLARRQRAPESRTL